MRSQPLKTRQRWPSMRASLKPSSRGDIENRLYAYGDEIESNAVEVHVHHLRRKLAPALIRTVRGVGYVMPRPGE